MSHLGPWSPKCKTSALGRRQSRVARLPLRGYPAAHRQYAQTRLENSLLKHRAKLESAAATEFLQPLEGWYAEFARLREKIAAKDAAAATV